jgi:hypothetical protein
VRVTITHSGRAGHASPGGPVNLAEIMQKLHGVIGAQVSLFAAASALSVQLPSYSFRTFITTGREFPSTGHNTASGPKFFTSQHNSRLLRISKAGSCDLCKRPDQAYVSQNNGFASFQSIFFAAERFRGQIERASHNPSGVNEIESKLRLFGRTIKSTLEKIRSDLKSRLKALRGEAVLAESAPEAPVAGSSSLQVQSDMTKV